jgi:hypothetical protein
MYSFKVILICLAGLSFLIFLTWLDQRDRNRYNKTLKDYMESKYKRKKDTDAGERNT